MYARLVKLLTNHCHLKETHQVNFTENKDTKIFFFTSKKVKVKKIHGIFNSGCSTHMTKDESIFLCHQVILKQKSRFEMENT